MDGAEKGQPGGGGPMNRLTVPMAEILEQIEFINVGWSWHKKQMKDCQHGKYAAYGDIWGPKQTKDVVVSMHLKTEGYIPSIVFVLNHDDNTRYYFIPIDPPRPLMIMSRYVEIVCGTPEIA